MGLDGGDVAGDGCLKQHGSVIGGVTWWQVVFPMTCLYKASTLRSKATQACQLPPPRHPLKNCPLLCYRSSLTHKRAEILRGKEERSICNKPNTSVPRIYSVDSTPMPACSQFKCLCFSQCSTLLNTGACYTEALVLLRKILNVTATIAQGGRHTLHCPTPSSMWSHWV